MKLPHAVVQIDQPFLSVGYFLDFTILVEVVMIQAGSSEREAEHHKWNHVSELHYLLRPEAATTNKPNSVPNGFKHRWRTEIVE